MTNYITEMENQLVVANSDHRRDVGVARKRKHEGLF